jgi:hypothetical protein
MHYGVLDTADGSTANASAFSNDTANGSLRIPGALAAAGLELNFTAISRIPTEPLLNQVQTRVQRLPGSERVDRRWLQVQVAALNATIDAMLLAELGIQYNVSDSDSDSDSGGGTVVASLTIDFVQRFNFSVAEDSTISFLSPQAGTQGYVPMLVFDKAGASTVLAESIFYNLKARPLGAVVCVQTAARSLATSCNSALTCSVASLDCAVPPDRLVRERRGLHTVPKGAVRLCALATWVGEPIETLAKRALRCATPHPRGSLPIVGRAQCVPEASVCGR